MRYFIENCSCVWEIYDNENENVLAGIYAESDEVAALQKCADHMRLLNERYETSMKVLLDCTLFGGGIPFGCYGFSVLLKYWETFFFFAFLDAAADQKFDQFLKGV